MAHLFFPEVNDLSLEPQEKQLTREQYLESYLGNKIGLIRRKLLFHMAWDDKTYPPGALDPSEVNLEHGFYSPLIDNSQFWLTTEDFLLPEDLKTQDSLEINIVFSIFMKETAKVESLLKRFLGVAHELSFVLDNMSTDKFKKMVSTFQLYELFGAFASLLCLGLLRLLLVRYGMPRLPQSLTSIAGTSATKESISAS